MKSTSDKIYLIIGIIFLIAVLGFFLTDHSSSNNNLDWNNKDDVNKFIESKDFNGHGWSDN